ncbi:S-methyl-5'-thioadenosine phosphorylase, partial [Favolaschia claudopus]
MATDKVLVGVIGGSGLYNLDNLTFIKHVNPETPWGHPSSPIAISSLPSGALVAFLARHGTHHTLPPSAIPSRAKIAALKCLGVSTILAFSALIDRTKGVRPSSFFEDTGVVAHAGFSDPYSIELGKWLAGAVDEALREEETDEGKGVRLWRDKTLVVMEGPQFSTRAESLMYRAWGGDIIGMTALPEAKLAREAEISFALIATATDYDPWRPHQPGVTATEVGAILEKNAHTSRHVAAHVIERLLKVAEAQSSEAKTTGSEPKGLLNEEKGCMRFGLMVNTEEKVKNVKLAYILPQYFTAE